MVLKDGILNVMHNKLESKILTLLRDMGKETHTEAVAEHLGIVRHTAAKYLQILQAKGQISCRKIGNAKLWQPVMAGLTIRSLLPEDIPGILSIQSQFEDEATRLAFIQMMEYHIECTDEALRLGADLHNQLIGFIVGEIRLWEFGGSEHTGWIKALAVTPEFQNQGIGRKLGDALLRYFYNRGIDRVRTLVNWHSAEMIAYFRALGFEIIPMLPLEKRLSVDRRLHATDATVTLPEKN